jgi:hypothetical protein
MGAMTNGRIRPLLFLLGISAPILVWLALLSRLPQPLQYHHYADERTLLGIPFFWNVASNLPFAAIGLFAVWWLTRPGQERIFFDATERRAYLLFFGAEFLTCFGSAYYHSAPTNATLAWDRVVFIVMLTAFFSVVITEFVSLRAGKAMLLPFTLLGMASVIYWAWTESRGHGDLRLYAAVQFYPMLAMPLILLLFKGIYGRPGPLMIAWALYGVAKVCELQDATIFGWLGFWSGHTLKHLVAAAASFLPLQRLITRVVRPRTA